MNPTVLITAKCHSFLFEQLQLKNYDIINLPKANYKEVLENITNCEGLITTTSVLIDKEIINAAPNLKWIGRLGSGMEHIDVEFATQKGIKCFSSPEGNCQAVAEHALGMLLALMNNINISSYQVKSFIWQREENRGEELFGKTVGIIGFGHTGSAFSALLQPFKVKLLVYDKYKSGFGNDFIIEATLEQIQAEADIISFHLPLTNEVKNFGNQLFFNNLNKSVYILNTSRGEVINSKSLIEALKTKKVKAAGLDVLENEKINSLTRDEKNAMEVLMQNPNVIITPHIAGYTHEAFYKMAKVLWEKLKL